MTPILLLGKHIVGVSQMENYDVVLAADIFTEEQPCLVIYIFDGGIKVLVRPAKTLTQK